MSDSIPTSAPTTNDFTWLDFQRANKGLGFSRATLSEHYRAAKGLPPKGVKVAAAAPAIPTTSTAPVQAPTVTEVQKEQPITVAHLRELFEEMSTGKNKVKADRKLSAYQLFTKEYYANNPELGKIPMKERAAQISTKWKEYKEANAAAPAQPAAPAADAEAAAAVVEAAEAIVPESDSA